MLLPPDRDFPGFRARSFNLPGKGDLDIDAEIP